MRLYKMVLHNFRQYGKNEVIKFPQDGLIGVLGKNGAGKSTLFNAIGWCLYGKIKDVNKDSIINDGADKKEECFVELFFELQGVKYHVKRDIKRTNECFLKTADGSPYAMGASNLTSYIEENLFKMDYNAFCSCYYAEQDDFDNLVKLTPAKRVQTVSKLLRIDDIDKASDNTRKKFRGLKVEVDEARKYLRNEDDLANEIKRLNAEIKSLTSIITKNGKDLGQLDGDYKNLLVEKANGEVAFLKHRELTSDLINTKEKMDTLIKRSLQPNEGEYAKLIELKKRYDAIEKYKKVYHVLKQQKEEMGNLRSDYREKVSIQKNIALMQSEIEKYTTEYTMATEELNQYANSENTLADQENQLTTLQNELEELKTAQQEITFIFNAKRSKITELKEMRDKFVELGTDSPCPTCDRPLGEHYEDKLEHIKQEVQAIVTEATEVQEKGNALGASLAEKNPHLVSLKTAITETRKLISKKTTLHDRVSFVHKELNARQEQLATLTESMTKFEQVDFDEEKFSTISAQLEKATSLYEEILKIENLITRIPDMEATIEEVKAEIENLAAFAKKTEEAKTTLKFDEEAYAQLDAKIRQLNSLIQTKKDEKVQNEFSVKNLEKDIEVISEKIAENKKMLSVIEEKEADMVLLGKLDTAFKQYKSDILSKLAPTLSDIMSDDIEIMTNGKYNQVELDDEYNIYVYRNGVKHPLSFYSGGEKKLAALCQRLAISGLLVSQTGQASFDMLAMDEVFGSMDNERQDNVVDMLRNLNIKFPQILIVTHSEYVKELFDYVIEIKQDEKGNSTFHWVTDWEVAEVDDLLSEFVGIEEAS